MNSRCAAVLGLAMISFIADGSASRADFNPFSDYYSNVARAAAQNDAETVRRLVGGDGNPNQTDERSRTFTNLADTVHMARLDADPEIAAHPAFRPDGPERS